MSEFLSTIVMVIVMWFGGNLVLASGSTLSAQEFIGYILIFFSFNDIPKISYNIILSLCTKR